MTKVDEGRRAFAAALGAFLLSPTLVESASQELRQTGTISRQTVEEALRLTGDTLSEAQMDQARRALEERLKDLEALRQFKVPAGLEPVTRFRAR